MITANQIESFEAYLRAEERSLATVEKYVRDVKRFQAFLQERELKKELTVAYKETLSRTYAPTSVNSMLHALNCFLRFIDARECCVKPLRIQRQIFCREETELDLTEYKHLLKAAEGSRLWYIMQTICGTGIRVSELDYITAEAVQCGRAVVNCKGKTRVIFLPQSVRRLLREYMNQTGVRSGGVFLTKNGNTVSRTNVWRDMKALCEKTGIPREKVFPHNLRHLFARLYYAEDKDIVHLADLLGHSSIETTRLYTVESGKQHLLCLERMQQSLAHAMS